MLLHDSPYDFKEYRYSFFRFLGIIIPLCLILYIILKINAISVYMPSVIYKISHLERKVAILFYVLFLLFKFIKIFFVYKNHIFNSVPTKKTRFTKDIIVAEATSYLIWSLIFILGVIPFDGNNIILKITKFILNLGSIHLFPNFVVEFFYRIVKPFVSEDEDFHTSITFYLIMFTFISVFSRILDGLWAINFNKGTVLMDILF